MRGCPANFIYPRRHSERSEESVVDGCAVSRPLFSALCSLLSALRPLPEILHCVALRKRMTGRKTSCHTCAASEGSICRCVVAGITGRSARANYSKRSMRTKSSKRAGDGETVVFKSFRISGQIKKTLLLYRSSLRTPRTLRTAALTNRAVIPYSETAITQKQRGRPQGRPRRLFDNIRHALNICLYEYKHNRALIVL